MRNTLPAAIQTLEAQLLDLEEQYMGQRRENAALRNNHLALFMLYCAVVQGQQPPADLLNLRQIWVSRLEANINRLTEEVIRLRARNHNLRTFARQFILQSVDVISQLQQENAQLRRDVAGYRSHASTLGRVVDRLNVSLFAANARIARLEQQTQAPFTISLEIRPE